MGQRPNAGLIETLDERPDSLIDREVATVDEHAIKFTEACLREYALNPQQVYLAAAKDATEKLARR